ncbi:EF-P beta-lysylation protein EpmB [Marinobacter sp. MDS2]|uniref:EF-P beta-lysylation protein EpmB n=1 Tax=Marinobacter sp. MDS2 TaxID=3065961 RepID=UPI00273C5C28|nr:EF-P beta-lysylation protein EpmB [Marinobacter sp. MDS2]MDP4547003.1 EF-P beta-lysylation protein EpmB [Marinobacter sp. MDS2]
MIQRTPVRIEARDTSHLSDHGTCTSENQSWQTILSRSISNPEHLLERLNLPAERWLDGARNGHELFPIRVPEPFVQRMEPGNPNDPLLRQVLPVADESVERSGFVRDPLEENTAIQTTGLIRKYHSRALLMVTGQCAINCRYCFRRHFPYNDHKLSREDRHQVITTLSASPEINEVILSGGDPLAVNDRLLAQWVELLEAVPHLKRLRIHSRLPVVIPQRVCDDMLAWLNRTRLQKVLVVHVNHPAEIDQATRDAFERLKQAGVTLLNQSVILKGVNDNAATLSELSETLFDAGVLPYYLHAFDPVAGAHHFDVSDTDAASLVRQLLKRLPGFLVPKLVREVPGEASKTPVPAF